MASLSVLTFILFTNLRVVMIVLKSRDLPSRKTQHRVPTLPCRLRSEAHTLARTYSQPLGIPPNPITGLRGTEETEGSSVISF